MMLAACFFAPEAVTMVFSFLKHPIMPALQFESSSLVLVALIGLGVLSHNASITIAACVLLLCQQTALAQYLPWIQKNGLNIGIIILTIGVLAPLASGSLKVPSLLAIFTNWQLLAAVAVGILVAWLGGRGVGLMSAQPLLVTGLLLGTIIGVAIFRGVPVGPLIAAGILSLVLQQQ